MQFVNYAFPDRKLYLFDTFSGFDEKEAINEIGNENCTDAFVEAYRHTAIEMVLSKMRYPEKVIIKQGLFPESLGGLEENFIFVSLDMDFEESIYAGLNYFYPRFLKVDIYFYMTIIAAFKVLKMQLISMKEIKGLICVEYHYAM